MPVKIIIWIIPFINNINIHSTFYTSILVQIYVNLPYWIWYCWLSLVIWLDMLQFQSFDKAMLRVWATFQLTYLLFYVDGVVFKLQIGANQGVFNADLAIIWLDFASQEHAPGRSVVVMCLLRVKFLIELHVILLIIQGIHLVAIRVSHLSHHFFLLLLRAGLQIRVSCNYFASFQICNLRVLLSLFLRLMFDP